MKKISGALRGMRVGLVATIIVVLGSLIYDVVYGPLYDVWGWREISIALLIILIMVLTGVVALLRSPNPYSRTNPLYGLMDLPPDRNLESGGAGWILQVIPSVVAIVVLAVSLALF